MKKLHTKSKIFFPKPKVVRVEYGMDIPGTDADKHFRDLCRKTYKLIKGTWGHSTIEYEQVTENKGDIFQIVDIRFVQRAYFVFEDELDELQFRLTIDSGSKAVKIWPEKILFTIHEYCPD